jgi:hypothetical protein
VITVQPSSGYRQILGLSRGGVGAGVAGVIITKLSWSQVPSGRSSSQERWAGPGHNKKGIALTLVTRCYP